MRSIWRALALVALAALSPLSAQTLDNPDSDFVDTTKKKAWHSTVEKTERGYLIGNPDAETRLVMFTSYGCEGCQKFAFRGDPELDYALLAPGIMSVEIRPRFAHPVDLPLALLARCGETKRFKINHAMFMRDHPRWQGVWVRSSAYNRAIWSREGENARVSLVSALDFDELMARRRGYSRMDLNTCLRDRRAASQLLANAAADNAEFELPTDEAGYARPHFALDGELLEGVRDWDALYEVLRVRFKPDRSE